MKYIYVYFIKMHNYNLIKTDYNYYNDCTPEINTEKVN